MNERLFDEKTILWIIQQYVDGAMTLSEILKTHQVAPIVFNTWCVRYANLNAEKIIAIKRENAQLRKCIESIKQPSQN